MKAMKTAESLGISSVIIKFSAADAVELNNVANEINDVLSNHTAVAMQEAAEKAGNVPVELAERHEIQDQTLANLGVLLSNITKHFGEFGKATCFDDIQCI